MNSVLVEAVDVFCGIFAVLFWRASDTRDGTGFLTSASGAGTGGLGASDDLGAGITFGASAQPINIRLTPKANSRSIANTGKEREGIGASGCEPLAIFSLETQRRSGVFPRMEANLRDALDQRSRR